jgi:hypothetical protein
MGSIAVRLEEVVQHVQETQGVLTVAMKLGLPDIIHDHVPDFFDAVLYAQYGTDKAGRHNFGDVLLFRDDEHHIPGRPAERNAIFQRYHSLYYLPKLPRAK